MEHKMYVACLGYVYVIFIYIYIYEYVDGKWQSTRFLFT